MNKELPDTTIEGPENIYLNESWPSDVRCWPFWVDMGFITIVVVTVVIVDWCLSRS